jgi:inner membrane protein
MLAIELAHPGVFLLIPATVLIVAGLLFVFVGPVENYPLVSLPLIVVAAFVAAFATVPYYRHIAPVHQPMSTTVGSLEGEVGLVIAPVLPNSLQGKVRIKSEIWSARSPVAIPAGTRVRVIGGEGVAINVLPIDPVPPP